VEIGAWSLPEAGVEEGVKFGVTGIEPEIEPEEGNGWEERGWELVGWELVDGEAEG